MKAVQIIPADRASHRLQIASCGDQSAQRLGNTRGETRFQISGSSVIFLASWHDYPHQQLPTFAGSDRFRLVVAGSRQCSRECCMAEQDLDPIAGQGQPAATACSECRTGRVACAISFQPVTTTIRWCSWRVTGDLRSVAAGVNPMVAAQSGQNLFRAPCPAEGQGIRTGSAVRAGWRLVFGCIQLTCMAGGAMAG